MISRFISKLRKLRRKLSRSEVAARLLRLPRVEAAAAEPGLILIQVDGLSRNEFERALAARRLPFLAHLLRRKDYRILSFYSGIPSTTPAVQGELFYGVRTAVPSFQFRDRHTGEISSFLDAATAARVEDNLKTMGAGLLEGGTAYSDIYTGGAKECSFCFSRLGFSDVIRRANPVAIAGIIISHLFIVVRMITLFVIELFLAVTDCVRGLIAHQDLPRELLFIPKRLAVTILLREAVSLGVRIDIARGMPIIHCNLLGYDEQSHRRGPSSRFAHWTLKGIDATIRGIWRSAARADTRHYDVWIYSDHGQEMVIPYHVEHGRHIEDAVEKIMVEHGLNGERTYVVTERDGARRAALLGGKRLQWLFRWPKPRQRSSRVAVAGMGPIGHIYVTRSLTREKKESVARDIVTHAQVPMVAVKDGADRARVWTARGEFALPEDAQQIMGGRHPFPAEFTEDLLNLIHHPNAGAFILFGWRNSGSPITFPIEGGSHAGPGFQETHGFALLPNDAKISIREGRYIRPLDLRAAAMSFTGRCELPVTAVVTVQKRVRIMTYNVHSCIGLDGRHAPERIARVIARCEPDIVALQECEAGRARSSLVHQAQRISELLEMKFHFHAAFRIANEQYGIAMLSRLPTRLVKAGGLPGIAGREPRGAMWVEVECHDRKIQFFNTHLGLRPGERMLQVEALMGEAWIAAALRQGPVVLCGDINALPKSRVAERIRRVLRDTQMAEPHLHRPATWMHLTTYDYIFVTPDLAVRRARVPHSHLAGVASDHLPVVVDLEI